MTSRLLFQRANATALSALAIVSMLACGKDSPTDPSPEEPTFQVSDFVAGISALDGSTAQQRTSSAPRAGAGPTITPTANQNVINGGSLLVRVRATAAFQTVYLSIGGSGRTTSGYWELRLSVPTTDTVIVVTFGRSIPVTSFDCQVVVATSGGTVGTPVSLPSRVVQAGTGDVQVSASWDAASDVDLHVVDPFGEEIYYGDSISTSGGELDLDSNAGCGIDGVNNENIRWPTGRAPSGNYTVRLDYWSSCSVSATNYVVTVNRGGVVSIFRGTFTGAGDRGGRGSGLHITSFTHSGSAVSLGQQLKGTLLPGVTPAVRPESTNKIVRTR